ncbi:MAG: XRE family transcriptional regulator [Hyphomicrobium sp.]
MPDPVRAGADITSTLGSNLRRLRTRRGYSLERLAGLSGVSRGMIGQIETSKSMPTVSLLWKLATALNVELTNLIAPQQAPHTQVLRRAGARTIITSDGKFRARMLSAPKTPDVEFFEVVIERGHQEDGERRAAGVRAHIVVASGHIAIAVGGAQATLLAARDAMIFAADIAHSYRNVGDAEAVFYVVFSDRGVDLPA